MGIKNFKALTRATGATTSRSAADQFADVVNVKNFGAVGDGVNDDTAEIQSAIDYAYNNGRAIVYLPDGTYKISASTLGETYDNVGDISSSNCGIVLRKGVSLIGAGRARCKITTSSLSLLMIAMVAPDGNVIQGLELAGAWAEAGGAGHGIITLGTAGGADLTTHGVVCRDLYIHDVGSYGIGFQAGAPNNCRIEDVVVAHTGADGLDLKSRTDTTTEPSANFASNITILNHGRRVEGSAGIDVRGIWHLSGITVKDYGGNASLFFTGVRFRTKPPAGDAYQNAGGKSSLTGFFIRPTSGALGTSFPGIECGSDHVHISNGTIEDCTNGVQISGNVNGVSQYAGVSNVSVLNASNYGFWVATGIIGASFANCSSVGAGTAGFRNEGTHTIFMGCRSISDAASKSTSAGGLPTEVVIGSTFSNEIGLTVNSAASGRVDVTPVGSSTNIDLYLFPKGSGVVRFGTHASIAAETLTGYITIKDAGGTSRKIAVIS